MDALVPFAPALLGGLTTTAEVTEVNSAIGFSAGETHTSLRRLRSGKTSSPNCIPTKMLKLANFMKRGIR